MEGVSTAFFYDERCAAFFALGRARASNRPVAVITTSGTAVGELLPAVMEAFYSGVPLLIISADRPRAFRGTGAPQAAEQVGIFGLYAPFSLDIVYGEIPSLAEWPQHTPAHLNVCFEEAYKHSFDTLPDFPPVQCALAKVDPGHSFDKISLQQFFEQAKHPIAIVGTLPAKDREAVVHFLKNSGLPLYCEGPSGIRERSELQGQRLLSLDKIWGRAEECGYPIDGVLRIGGVPTTRIWRDLEAKEGKVRVCSISHLPYSGLSWGNVIYTDLSRYLSDDFVVGTRPSQLIEADRKKHTNLNLLLAKYPESEPALFRQLSELIPKDSLVYIGNSLPIREWDLAATFESKQLIIEASRGLNGIDGQLSTFLGVVSSERSNWAIVGDLTALYDLSAPWIIRQLQATQLQIVVINNGGGKIFSRLFTNEKLQNQHDYSLKGMADIWGIDYLRCEGTINISESDSPRVIECIPDVNETDEFWNEYA